MRALVAVVLVVVAATLVGPVGAQQATDDRPNVCVGTIEEQPDASTVMSIQGARFTSEGAFKEPALLLSAAPNGSVEWIRNSSANGRWFAYDVDPLDNGNLLYVTTQSQHSVVGEFDPDTGEYVWVEHFDGRPDSETNPLVVDAHDADLIGDELIIVDKGEGHERLLAYNLTSERVTWEWRFEDHPEAFPKSGGGPSDDWTHVNDVDRVNESLYMISVRNFDQVAFVDRTTDEVALTLGEDDRYEILDEQHNPDHLWGPNGEHTVLVADSENDRVVEYEYDAASGTWDRVWAVSGFDKPRDADRLENGNTLVTDRRGHRVVEITPQGRTVWEFYTPYQPYDAERNEARSNGPTMREQNVTGQFEVSNDAGFTTDEIERCASWLFAGAPADADFGDAGSGDADSGDADSGDAPADSDPVRAGESGPPVVPIAVAGLLVSVIVLGLGYRRYR